MQQQIYTNEYKEICRDELVRARNKYDEKRYEVENLYFEKYSTPLEAIMNFISKEKEIFEYDDVLLKEEHDLVIEFKRQGDFINSPPQYKEGYKYISSNGECLMVYQRINDLEEYSHNRQKQEDRREIYLFLKPSDPAIEESRVLLN